MSVDCDAGSTSKCSVSGCPLPADIDFDCATLPGYSTQLAARKTQVYCTLPYVCYKTWIILVLSVYLCVLLS